MKYHVWTIGCQMNTADSQRLGSALETLGYQHTDDLRQADVIVLNTCVVRQSAEDRATGFLWSLKPLKTDRPETVIGLMGCMVGVKTRSSKGANGRLQDVFPHVDVLMPPGQPEPLIDYLLQREGRGGSGAEMERRYQLQDGTLVLPLHQRGRIVSAPVPVVDGCNHVCSYCVIPARRGQEHSRPMDDIVTEVRSLVDQGVKEVVLLGQIVDRYGYDRDEGAPRLPHLLRATNEIQGLERIRFLTSHPSYFDQRLIDAVAELPKVCQHVEVPIQAGDDQILERMRRGYTADDYRRLIHRIRERLPQGSIATDVIVGFPGESESQFQTTLDLLAELKIDVCHVATYSPRPSTLAAKTMADDVPPQEKTRRLQAVMTLQEAIVADINRRLLGQRVQVLVEEKHKGKWKGRTRTNKLVFFEDAHPPTAYGDRGWQGRLVDVSITWTGPWSMQAQI